MNSLELPGASGNTRETLMHGVGSLASKPRQFRLWIAEYSDWRPRRWNDAPPQATSVELIEDTSFTEEEARLFLEGFNSQMLQHNRPLWAVAVPIVVRYEGDSRPGQTVRGYVFDEPSA